MLLVPTAGALSVPVLYSERFLLLFKYTPPCSLSHSDTLSLPSLPLSRALFSFTRETAPLCALPPRLNELQQGAADG